MNRRRWLHLIPLGLSVFVWLPMVFLAGGSLMDSLELTGHLRPVLTGKDGFATWALLPRYPTLQPYVELLLDSPSFFVMFWNSVRLAAGILLGHLLVAVPAAWWFARGAGKWGRGLFTLYIALMLMPFQVTMVGSYLVLDATGILNTHLAILLPGIFSTFPVFIIYRFFRAIPQPMLEAAQIDGASSLQVFLHIGIPCGKAGVAAAMVLGLLDCWNLIEQPMTFLKAKSLWPLSLYLPRITAEKAGLALAASVITLLPPLLVFLFGQSYLEQGIVGTGGKE